ncbi:MAG: MogA/MoaB family molybdenum cofactor biosynthesis protein [Anaerolineae bacterium]|nr:MogA/MoaB family molybdenum cofactor biosynthesis protein [Anaerolineae bacterium]
MNIRAGVVIVSDKGYAGERADASGPLLAELLQRIGAEVIGPTIVPDEPEQIEAVLIHLADVEHVDVVLTSGGTGPTPRDQTPEATLAVIERQMPGLAEVLRFEGYRKTPLAVISRGVAGIRGRTIIVNLPGSPKAVREGMETLAPILPHAVRMVRGVDTTHEEETSHHAHA